MIQCSKECKDDKNTLKQVRKIDLDAHLKNECPNRDYTCVYCGEKGTHAHITKIHDGACEKKLLCCPNAGCTKTIERQVFYWHVETDCKFTMIECSKRCKDDRNKVKKFTKKDIDAHLKNACPNRDYTCEYCEEKDTYANITQIHDGECEKKLLCCPNAGCTELIQRKDMMTHAETKCDFMMISCKYGSICQDVVTQKDIAAHEEHHLLTAIEDVLEIKQKLIELKREQLKLRNKQPQLREKQRELRDEQLKLRKEQQQLVFCMTILSIILVVVLAFCYSLYKSVRELQAAEAKSFINVVLNQATKNSYPIMTLTLVLVCISLYYT